MKRGSVKEAAAIFFLATILLEAAAYYYVTQPGTYLQEGLYGLLARVYATTSIPYLQNFPFYLLTNAKMLLFVSAAIAMLPQKEGIKKDRVIIFIHGKHVIRARTAAFTLAMLLFYDHFSLFQLTALTALGWTAFVKERTHLTSIIIITSLVLLIYAQNPDLTQISGGSWQTIAIAKNALKNPLMPYDGNYEDLTYYTHPPLSAYVLAVFFLFFGATDITAVYAKLAITIAILVATYYTGKALYGGGTGKIAMYLLAFAPLFYFSSANVHTDAIFALLYLGGLFAVYIANKKGSSRLFAISGLTTGAAVLTKEAGVLLWLAAVLYFRLYGKHEIKKIVLFTAVVASAVGLWVLQGTLEWNSFTDAVEYRMGETLHTLERPWNSGFFSARFASSFVSESGGILLILSALGMLRACKTRNAGDVLMVAAAIIPVAYFLFLSNIKETRYLLPSMPPLALIGARSIEWALGRKSLCLKTIAMSLLILAAIPLVTALKPAYTGVKYAEETKTVALYIAENYGKEYLIISKEGPAFNFYSGNKYLLPPLLQEYEEEVYGAIDKNEKKTIVVLESGDAEFEYVNNPGKLGDYLAMRCSLQAKFQKNEVYLC